MFVTFLKCSDVINSVCFSHFLHRRTKESMGRQEKLKEEQRHRMKVRGYGKIP